MLCCCHPEILYFLTRTPHFHFALDSAPHCLQGLKELTSGGLQEALGPAMTGKWPLLCVSVFPPTQPWRQSRGPCDCGLLGRERKQGASMAGLPLGRCLNRTTAPGTPREALPRPTHVELLWRAWEKHPSSFRFKCSRSHPNTSEIFHFCEKCHLKSFPVFWTMFLFFRSILS